MTGDNETDWLRVEDPKQFLNFVFADKADDETICVSKGNPNPDKPGDMLFWNLEPEHEAFTGWAAHPHRSKQAWYVSVSTVDGERNEKGTALRRAYPNLKRMHALVFDDINTKASPPPVEPAWKIETSAGNYQYGYLIEPTDNFKRAEALLEYGHGKGWGDAGAGGAYRIVRIPGSCNLKPGRDKFIARAMVARELEVWPLDDLAAALGISPAELDEAERKHVGDKRTLRSGGARSLPAPTGQFVDPLLTWLQDNKHVIGDRGGDFVDVVCPWAKEHTDGNNAAGYSPLGRGSDYDERRSFKCLHEHCKDRHYAEFSDWVQQHGGPDLPPLDPLSPLLARYVFVKEGSLVADIVQRERGGKWIWTWREFQLAHKRAVVLP